jgi:ferredoxin
MTYVIAEPCKTTKDTALRRGLPGRLHPPDEGCRGLPTAEMLYINPDECIDCGACTPECPVDAIFDEAELPEKWVAYTKINAEWYAKNR